MIRAFFFLLLLISPAAAQQKWTFQYSVNAPVPVPYQGGWAFVFPKAPGDVDYLTTPGFRLTEGKMLVLAGRVNMQKGALFRGSDSDGSGLPPNFRFMLRAQDDGCLCKNFGRWWSDSYVTLKHGTFVLRAPLTADHWTSVFGHRANSSGAALAAWRSVLRNPARIGVTFGAGNNFGHGVYTVGSGRASMSYNFRMK